MIKGLIKGKPVIEIKCDGCGCEYESRYNKGQVMRYLKEVNEYENFASEPCPDCNSVKVINLNVPSEELEESFFEEVGMPEEDKIDRRVLKDFMTELSFENISELAGVITENTPLNNIEKVGKKNEKISN